MSTGELSDSGRTAGSMGGGLRACKGATKSGLPCRSIVVRGSDFCLSHHPDLAEERRQARSAGGKTTTNRRKGLAQASKFRDLAGALDYRDALTDSYLRKQITAQEAETLSRLGEGKEKLLTGAALEERLGELETRVLALAERRSPVEQGNEP